MTNVLIVDDILWIRKGIRALLEKKYKFEFCEAGNGDEAMRLIHSTPVDLVITDIRMPVRDGISLLRETRKLGKDIPFIIISGFSEFEYAEQALNMGAIGYLLKPVQADQLYRHIDTALQAINRLHHLDKITSDYDKLRQQLQDRHILEGLRQLLLEGCTDLGSVLQQKLFSAETTCFAMLLINISSEQPAGSLSVFSDNELVRYCVSNVAEEICRDFQPITLPHPVLQQQIFVLLGHHLEPYLAIEKDRMANLILQNVRQYLKLRLAIGTSQVQNALQPDLTLQAQRALQMRIIQGNEGVYRYESLVGFNTELPVEELQLLDKHLQRRDMNNIQALLRGIFAPQRIGPAVAVYTRYACRSILDSLVREYGPQVYDLVDPNFLKEDFLDNLVGTEDIVNSVLTNIRRVMASQATGDSCEDNLISRVRTFIDEHYREDLSLKSLADKFNISYSYLSTLFKQETGLSVVTYLTNYRLETAARMLTTTTADIASIAEMIGYSDLNYFYRLFKKQYGITPLAYRNQKYSQ
jgi:two-component system response regulator YesN